MDELQEQIKDVLANLGGLDPEQSLELGDFLEARGDLGGVEGLAMSLAHVLEWVAEEA